MSNPELEEMLHTFMSDTETAEKDAHGSMLCGAYVVVPGFTYLDIMEMLDGLEDRLMKRIKEAFNDGHFLR